MRSRAAILPYPGDPFLLNYWLKFFDEIWGEEVDKLYIYLNCPAEEAVINYIRHLCNVRPKINLQYHPAQTEHGTAIDRTLDIVTEKYVMLIEDDAFIFKKGVVDSAFKKIESGEYDIVGSKRGSCSFEILEKAKEKWGLNYEGLGDQGCNFWPNYFFSTKELLLKTDRNFNSRAWNKGDKIEPLDWVVDVDQVVGDTFVNTSLQLQNMVPQSRILYLPQYHGSPDDLEHFAKKQYLFDGHAPWTHIGSLSSGVGGLLKDDFDRPLSLRKVDPPKEETILPKEWCQTEGQRWEFERRVQWWATFYDYAKDIPADLKEYHGLYAKALARIILQFKLSTKRIHERQAAYRSLGL